MRDRALEGALALGALDVDVDPLMIAREIGELVDHLLRDLEGLAPVPERSLILVLSLSMSSNAISSTVHPPAGVRCSAGPPGGSSLGWPAG